MSGDAPRTTGWLAPTTMLTGDAASAPGSPDGYPLWLVRGELRAHASLSWTSAHGDEVLYVARGEVRADGRVCPEGGAVIVEAGVPAELIAERDAELLHFGPADPTPPTNGHFGPSEPGCHVHVVGPRGIWSQVDDMRDTRFFADSTCPTCRATLLYTARTLRDGEVYESPAHSHSQDELIHIVHGELQLGATIAHAGDTLAIAGDARYKFRSPAPGFGFLNYRRDVSLMTVDRSKPPMLEGGAVHGFDPAMDLR